MIQRTVRIINKLGLHARASMELNKLAEKFESDAIICFEDKRANAKDILNLMTLAASQGTEIEVEVSGPDEVEAATAILALINNRFGEAS